MFIQVNDVQLYYEIHGNGSRPFILLHGNGESTEIFSTLAGQLSRQYTVYAIDSRGHGRSSSIPEYHYMDMMEDVAEFIRKLNLKEALLYGFSDGGITGLLLAIYHPELTAGLMISGANTFPIGVTDECFRDTCQEYEETGNPMVGMMVFEPDITTKQLESISIPVQVIAGQYDLIRPEHTKYIAEAIPESRLVIVPGEDHGSYVINNPVLYKILRPFLTEFDFIS